MLNIPIEKEIRHESTVLNIGMLSLNARQTVLGIIGLVIAIAAYLIFRNWILMVVFTLPFAAILLFLAKPDVNGKKAEEALMEKAELMVYKNDKRKYRTKNQYAALMNGAYRKMREEDEADRAARKEKIRREKEIRKKRRASRMREIA